MQKGIEETRAVAPQRGTRCKERIEEARVASPLRNAQKRQAEQEAECERDDERLIVGPEGPGLTSGGGGTAISSPSARTGIESPQWPQSEKRAAEAPEQVDSRAMGSQRMAVESAGASESAIHS